MGKMQPVRPNTSMKFNMSFTNFAGGLNTVTANDLLKDEECVKLVNVNLAERGSLQRRFGMGGYGKALPSGKGQGFFVFKMKNGTKVEIAAIEGKLYNVQTGAEITIAGLPYGYFQKTRPVEAVVYRDNLYIATGSDLVEFNGTTAKVVEPYVPNPLEYMYVGGNALSDKPAQNLQHRAGTTFFVDYLIPEKRVGYSGANLRFDAYVTYTHDFNVGYSFSYRLKGETNWVYTRGKDANDNSRWGPNNTTIQFNRPGIYEIRVEARQGIDISIVQSMILPNYVVSERDENIIYSNAGIRSCNKILVYLNRLWLYGDTSEPDFVYIADIDNPRYFPMYSTLRFENTKQEPLRKLIEFRNTLIAFTDTSIQGLFGDNLSEIKRRVINPKVGTKCGNSAVVVGNYLAFLSAEGIYFLKNLTFSDNQFNIEKIDTLIDNEVLKFENDACAIFHDGQYQLTFPNNRKRIRFYETYKTWVTDESIHLDFDRVYAYDGLLYGQSKFSGRLALFNTSSYQDFDHVYEMLIETKAFVFDHPYNKKKFKEMQILMGQKHATEINAYVDIDGAMVVNPDANEISVINGEIFVKKIVKPSLTINTPTIFGEWKLGTSKFGAPPTALTKIKLSGKGYRAKLKLSHNHNSSCHMLGVAFTFKMTKI